MQHANITDSMKLYNTKLVITSAAQCSSNNNEQGQEALHPSYTLFSGHFVLLETFILSGICNSYIPSLLLQNDCISDNFILLTSYKPIIIIHLSGYFR